MSVEAVSWPGADPNVAPPIKKQKGEQRPYIVAITPAAILLSAFFIFPALWVIYTSTTSLSLTNLTAGTQYVGLDNYRRLWNNPDFPKFVKNTIVFTIGAAMIGQTLGGLLVALLIHHAQIHKHKLAPVAFTAEAAAPPRRRPPRGGSPAVRRRRIAGSVLAVAIASAVVARP